MAELENRSRAAAPTAVVSARAWAASGLFVLVAVLLALPFAGRAQAQTLSIDDASATEGSGVVFTVTLSAASTDTVTVSYATSVESGNTAEAADFTAVTAGTLTFTAGDTSESLTVSTVQDTTDEDDETFTVTLSDATNAAITDATGTGTINDDDPTPTATATPHPVLDPGARHEVTEGETASWTVTLSAASERTLTSTFDVSRPALTGNSSDFTNPAALVFAPMETEKTATVATVDDRRDEPDERFSLTTPSFSDVRFPTVHFYIVDNDDPPTLSIADASADEGNGAEFTATLSRSSEKTVTVRYTASVETGDTAASGDLSGTLSGTLTFAGAAGGGPRSRTFTIATRADTVDEDNETFTVTLSNPSNATIDDVDDATGTIVDDDSASLSINDASASEGVGVGFTVTLSTSSQKTVTVRYATSVGTDDTAESTDFTAVTSTVMGTPLDYATLTFTPGDTSENLTVSTVEDTVDEDNETFTVTLSDATNAAITDATGTGTVNDDDPTPTATFTPDPVLDPGARHEVTEGGTASWTVTLSAASERTLTATFGFGVGAGDANFINTSDHTQPAPLIFSPGDTEETVSVTAVDDMIDEPVEALVLGKAPDSEVRFSLPTAVFYIIDNDDPPTLSINDASADEGDGAEFTATLSAASEKTITVGYTASVETGDTAASGDLSGTPSGTLTFARARGGGPTSRTFTIATKEDNVDEDDETFTVTLSNPSNATIDDVDDATGTGTIVDDDSAALSITDASATEGGGVVFRVTLSTPSQETVTVRYAASVAAGDTAESTDFTAVTSMDVDTTLSYATLTFAPGQTSKNLTVATTQDMTDEDNETFTVTLSNAANASITDATGTGTINDNDAAPKLRITGGSADEGESVSFPVLLSTASEKTVTVRYATSVASGDTAEAADFTAVTSTVMTATVDYATLTFSPSETSKTVTVSTTEDTVDEDNETFTMTLSNPANATIMTAGARGTIDDDDDPPTIRIVADASATEGSDVEFTVELSAASEKRVSYRFDARVASGDTAESTDLSTGQRSFTLSPGTTSRTHATSTRDDSTDEDDETFTVSLAEVVNATIATGEGTRTGTINDDDDPPTVEIAAASASEGDDVEFTVRLSARSEKVVTIAYATSVASDDTAKAADFTAVTATTLTFSAGDTSKTAPVGTVEDDIDERDETFTATLSGASNTTIEMDKGSATGTIRDDDPTPTATLALSPLSVGENSGTAVTVTASLNHPSTEATTVTVTAAAVSPAVAGDFELSANRTLTIAAEQTASTGTVSVTPVDNDVDAPDKRVRVSATAQNDHAVSGPADVHLAVTDNEPPPKVTLVVADSSIRESDDAEEDGDQHVTTVRATQEHPSSEATTVTITASAGDFTLSSSGRLTIAAGATESSASVTLTAVDNDVDAPDKELKVVATAVNTQGVEQPDGVGLTIEDEDPAPDVTLTLSATTLGEVSGRVTVRAGLSHPSSEATTVTLTATAVSPAEAADFVLTGSILTIPAGDTRSSGAATLTAVDNDVDAPDKEVTVSAAVANTQGVGATPGDETLTITDDDPAPSVTLHLSRNPVGEAGGQAAVTARLSHPSSEATTVTVTAQAVSPAAAADYELAGSSLSIPAGLTDSVGTVTLTAEDNDVDASDKRVRVSGAAANSQGIAGDPADVTLTIADDDTRGFVWNPAVFTTRELWAETYTVALTSKPTDTVTVTVSSSRATLALGSLNTHDSPAAQKTLTFTAQNWSTAQQLRVLWREEDSDLQTGEYSIRHSAAGGDYAGLSRNYPATVLEFRQDADDVLVLSTDRIRVREGEGLVNIRLLATVGGWIPQQSTNVAVTVAAGTATADDFTAAPETFTMVIPESGFSVNRTFQLQPNDDGIDEGDETVRITATLAGVAVTPAVVTIMDDDTRGVTVTPSGLQVGEGGSRGYTVVLDSEPSGEVTVTPSVSGNSDVTVSPAALTFTADNWETAQTVTVSAADDADVADDQATVRHTVSGADYGDNNVTAASVLVTVADDDGRGVVVSTRDLAVQEGGSATYTVALNSQPTGSVTVRPSATGDGDVTASPAALTFTAASWETAQTVTVSAANDADAANDRASISHAVSGADYGANRVIAPEVLVTVSDAGRIRGRATLTTNPRTVTENRSASVTVTATLDGAARTTDTVVTVLVRGGTASANDFSAGPAAFLLTIRANQTSGTARFTLRAGDDGFDDDDETVILSATADFLDIDDVVMTITDDDERGLRASPSSLTVDEDSSAVYRVGLNSRPTDTVTVTPAVDGAREVTVSPETLTFTSTDWKQQKEFTVFARRDADGEDDDEAVVTHTAAGGDYDGVEGGTVMVDVRDDGVEFEGVSLGVDLAAVDEGGGTRTVTVTADLAIDPFPNDTVLTVVVEGGTATEGTDFADVADFTLTIAANQTQGQGTFELTPEADIIDEGEGETVLVSATAPDLLVRRTEVTITDDDETETSVTLTVSPESVSEGAPAEDQAVTVTAAFAAAARTEETEVRVSVRAGTARQGTDFAAVSDFVLTIPAGMTSGEQAFTLAPVDDNLDEPDETVVVRGRASGLDVTPSEGVEVTIADDEDTPEATLVLTPATIREDGGVSRVTATLSPASSQPTTITVSAVPAAGTEDGDFRQSGTRLSIRAGATRSSGTVTLRATDNEVEAAANKQVTVSGVAENSFGVEAAVAARTLTITDDESPSTGVVLTVSPDLVREGRSRRVGVTARLNGAERDADTEVAVTVSGDTATEGDDFDAVAGFTLTIAAGRTSGTGAFDLAALDDELDELDETVRVAGTASGLTVTGAAVTITEQAPPPPPRPPRPPEPPQPVLSVTLAASPQQVGEGAAEDARTVTVTATLAGEPRAEATEVAVTVSGGTAVAGEDFAAVAAFTVTIAAGETSGTGSFELVPVDDAVDEGDETVAVTGSASGATVLPAGGLEVTIADDDERGVTVTPAALSVSKGGSGSYEVSLTSRPTAAVTVEVSSDNPAVTAAPALLRFEPEQWEEAREVTVTAAAGLSDGAMVELTHTVAGGDYGEVAAEAVTVTVTALDVTLALSPERVSEGAAEDARTVTVTATLAGEPRAEATEVAVTVSGGTAVAGEDFAAVAAFTVTIAAGETSGTGSFELVPVDDAVDEGDETVVVTGSASGATVLPAGGLEVTIADDDERGVTVTPAALSVSKGGSGSYEVSLTSRPTAAVTIEVSSDDPAVTAAPALLRFEPEQWEEAREVTVTAAEAAGLSDGAMVELTHTVAGGDYGEVAAAAAVTVTVTALDVTLALSPERVSEGAAEDARTVTVTATLDGAARPVDTEVTVTVTGGPAVAGEDFVAVAAFTVTIAAGETSGTGSFELVPVDDAVDEGDETVVVTGSASGATVLPAGGLEVTIADDDERGVTVTPAALSVSKGGSGSYEVSLTSRPTAAVTVEVSSDDPAVTASPALLRFEPEQWEEAREVTVTAAEAAGLSDGAMVELTHTVAGGDYGEVAAEAVTVTVTAPGVTLALSPERVSENAAEDARTVTVTATLAGEPRAEATEVAVTVSGGTAVAGEDFAAVAAFTVTIAAGETSGTGSFELVPVDDAVDEGDETVVVTGRAPGTGSPVTLLTIVDDDERGVMVMPTALTVPEGGSGAYAVTLASQPTSDVTITVSSDDSDVTADPSTLTFTASGWNTSQTVAVGARDDELVEDDATARLTHAARGGGYGSVTVDSVAVTVPGHEVDGMAATFKVSAAGEVAVPDGTPVPSGTRVTLPAALAGETLVLTAVADGEAPADPPRGFRAGDAVVDIELGSGMALAAGQTATVCLPVEGGGREHVYRYDESPDPPAWVRLEEPSGGSPAGLACGVTDRFSLFAVVSPPNEAVARGWLGRFGRMAAQQVVDAVQDRMTAARTAGLEGTLAGQGIGGTDRKAWESAIGRPGAGGGLEALERRIEAGSGWAEDGGLTFRPLTVGDLLGGTRFSVTGSTSTGESVGLWGRGAMSRFSGREGEARLEGDVATAMLGADWASGDDGLMAGLALSHSRGDGVWQREGGEQEDEVESSLTGVYPYVAYEVTDRLSVWGVAGHGRGGLTIPDGSRTIEADIDMTMTAAGVRSDLLRAGSGGGPDLALKVDGLYLRIGSNAAQGLEAVEADVGRVRLGVEGSWAMGTGNGPALTPSVEIGVRHDWGGVETGMGVEVGGGLAYSDPGWGVTARLNARGLVAHKAEDFEDWGVSGALAVDLDPSSERGFSVSLRQSLGSASSDGVDALFRRDGLTGLAGDGNAGNGNRLEAETAYGFGVLEDRFTGTPYLRFGVSRTGRDYTLGWRLAPLPSRDVELEFRAGATRRETAGEDEPEHGVALEAKLRW